jgi:16S rRNA A1518/A1519 N6-dimethyltransferase RsmA/KsgA/DIM1 with predicted DNA glycosylase/AP lyase activity
MDTEWQISSKQKELLDVLFEKIEGRVKNVLDVGSGRTSIFYLTERYKDTIVEGIIYPRDDRKISPIKECVKNDNYKLIETDILDFNPDKSYDVILAHLFLGEAEKFGDNKFEKVLAKLFSIGAKYLAVVNLFSDNINYSLLLKQISEYGDIIRIKHVVSEDGETSLGMLIKRASEPVSF